MKSVLRCLFLLLAFGHGALALAQAVVTEIRGNAYVQVGNGPEEPLVAGRKIPAGAVVRTAVGSMAVLGFPDRQICVLGEVSTFRIVDYRYENGQADKGQVSLNLINGSMRMVLGEIGMVNPGAIRVQIGVATMGILPSPESRTDASVVVLGGPVTVSVQEGRAVVMSPSGLSQPLNTGEGLFLDNEGLIRRGNISNIAALVGNGAEGLEILRQLASLQGTTGTIQQTVITLASLLPTDEILSAPASSTSATAGTAGSGGGGNVASPN